VLFSQRFADAPLKHPAPTKYPKNRSKSNLKELYTQTAEFFDLHHADYLSKRFYADINPIHDDYVPIIYEQFDRPNLLFTVKPFTTGITITDPRFRI